MPARSTETTLSFSHPFRLSPLDHAQPAGRYQLVTEEEQLEGLSFAAFQRVRTLLYLPAKLSSRPRARGRQGRSRRARDGDGHRRPARRP